MPPSRAMAVPNCMLRPMPVRRRRFGGGASACTRTCATSRFVLAPGRRVMNSIGKSEMQNEAGGMERAKGASVECWSSDVVVPSPG